ncbi:MAG: YtxH domain-containing protein [Pedobacter sp.]|nr:MAG: YtxH domain-containing protein [Pedobacter sp.]
MNYRHFLKNNLLQQRSNNLATVAIIGGVAVGLALGALFATKKGKSYRKKLARLFDEKIGKLEEEHQLGNLVEDVRTHAKQTAESLLGPTKKRKNASEVHADKEISKAWKEPKEKSKFPDEVNPKLG